MCSMGGGHGVGAERVGAGLVCPSGAAVGGGASAGSIRVRE